MKKLGGIHKSRLKKQSRKRARRKSKKYSR